MNGRVLVIAGSDSGGGAGIQGDIKTVSALGGYAATAITALTAQNTIEVHGICAVTPEFVSSQIEVVLSDIGADAIKTGMLFNADIIRAVSKSLTDYATIPLVIDPVMVAKGGAKLLQEDAIEALCGSLIPKAALLTPNIPEASLLAEMEIKTVEDMEKAGLKLLSTYRPQAVLMKGGHLEGFMTITNLLITDQGTKTFTSGKINSQHTHGTGCTLASAVASYLAQGNRLNAAVEKAIRYVEGAIRHAPKLGKGHGPLNHGWQTK